MSLRESHSRESRAREKALPVSQRSVSVSSELQLIYERRFRAQEQSREAVWSILVSKYFQRWIQEKETVLDLGAGYCEFINHVKAAKKYALDANPESAARASTSTQVITQDVATPWHITSSSIDVIFSSNFLEHLPSKEALQFCLREAHRVLRPNGRILLLGPNIRFCANMYWDFFDHHLPLSDRSVVEVLELSSFRVENVIPRFLPFTMKGKEAPPFLVSLYLRMPLLWPVLGKQFFIVASKI